MLHKAPADVETPSGVRIGETNLKIGLIVTRLALVAICLLTAGGAVAGEPARNPNSAKACAICHYRWIDTFFVEGRGTDLVPYESKKVVATPEMCFSCHDGSVRDSRRRIRHGNQHRTDAKPPPGMVIPAIFPLDDDGKVQCATCHTAHGVESGPGVEETIFLRMSNNNSAMCRACHPDMQGGPAAGNHSMEIMAAVPKALAQSGAHIARKENRMICETCHTAHGSHFQAYLVRDDGDSSLCLDCHADKGMFTPSGIRNSNHAFNVKPVTAAMVDTINTSGGKLGTNGVIGCESCHDIHNNPGRQPSLLIRDNQKSDLCLTCHPDKRRLAKTRHNLAVSAKAEKNLEGHTAVESGMCSACHLPHHAARQPYTSNKPMDRTTAQCMSCHAEGRVAANTRLAGYGHPVDVHLPARDSGSDTMHYRTISSRKDPIDLPLFNDLGVSDPGGKITCATCHDIHGGSEAEIGAATEQDDPGRPNTILRKASPDICRQCHTDKFKIENSRHDLGVVFPKGNDLIAQKVDRPDLCRYCHRIHSSEPQGFVWNRQITTPSGDTLDDRCTACHAVNGLAPEMTTGKNSHPVNTPLTCTTRTTALPLFSAQGKPSPSGIMTCYTCHDPHRSSPANLERNGPVSPGGEPENHFLRIAVAPSSDLCLSCHGDKADVLQSDHNLLITAPSAKNALGKKPFESGVCGACHIVHNSTEKIDLWAMAPGTGSNVMEKMCNSCHNDHGAAAAKVPLVSSHPDTLFVSVWEKNRESAQNFPFFDTKTGQVSPVGNISCPSCHDVHHWSASPGDDGGQKNPEGDALTSFLRPNVAEEVCRQCHGPEGLFVFKYFHKPGLRSKKQ